MNKTMNCGEAVLQLLEQYGVDTVFGIPGVHTLELYRGLADTNIKHIQARNEQGAGFMADGYARVSGKPGVCLLISGPGVTNAATAMGQAYADSIPMLVISSDCASYSLAKGWGCLHEVTDLTVLTAPLTALSATARCVDDVEDLLAQAFAVFASERPRPVHIAIPIDILAQPVNSVWQTRTPAARPAPDLMAVNVAAKLLSNAKRPMIYAGGGAISASAALTAIAEILGAAVFTTNAGKGIVADSHPLALGGVMALAEGREFLASADVVLAIGTELAETDSIVEKMEINGQLIRVDIDNRKINDLYPAAVGIVADAGKTAEALLNALHEHNTANTATDLRDEVSELRERFNQQLTASERQHVEVLNALRECLPPETVVLGDITQLVYTGTFAFPVEQPRQWHYPAGYCTLGCALPNAIGAKFARPDTPMIVFVGDGGFMFTAQELVTAVEQGLALPIILWNNRGYQQIRDGMRENDIEAIGVSGLNPDFIALAQSCGAYGARADTLDDLQKLVLKALQADRPTLIEVL